ncbi:MAG: glucosaminidase domain-containing protein [Bacteroidia bacterium]|nr:glucosaminidase domain-containing protein [Bacteroidia bacterium]
MIRAQLNSSTIDKLNYIVLHKQLAIQQMLMYGIPASITLAQGIIETKAGRSELVTQANNHFGIKCKRDWAGSTYSYTDDAPDECFRAYDCAEDSYTDHSQFLATRPWYASLFELHTTDYCAWASGLKSAGYATDKAYAQKLITVIETFELNQYDYIPLLVSKKIEIPTNVPSAPYYRFVQDHILYYKNNAPFIVANRYDTYYRIAKAYNLKLEQLYKYNDLDPNYNMLRVDDIVFLKQKHANTNEEIHIVKYKETPLAIAQLHAIKLRTLCKLNKIEISSTLMAGTVVYLNKKAKRTAIQTSTAMVYVK